MPIKIRQALPGGALPLVLVGGILLLVTLGWVFYTGGNNRQAAEADARPDIFTQSPGDSKR